MSCMTPTVMKEPLVDVVNSDMLMSDPVKVLDLDLVYMKKEDVNFASSYRLRMNYNDRVHGLIAWFDTPFSRLTRPNLLSTSPFKKYTHWKQTVFYTEKDIEVRQGDILFGSVAVRQSKSNFRELDIKISYHVESPLQKTEFVNMYKLK